MLWSASFSASPRESNDEVAEEKGNDKGEREMAHC